MNAGRRIVHGLVVSLVFAAAAVIAAGPSATAGTASPAVERVAKLTASDATAGRLLGLSVVVTDDLIVAGAPGGGSDHGAVYIYERNPSDEWANATETARLTPSDATGNDRFGASVAVDGDTIVVGAPGNQTATGAAYVFTKPATGWVNATETAKLTASDGGSTDVLGASVAITGTTVVAGAPASTTLHPSALYVFEEPPSGWTDMTETAKLTQSDPTNQDKLGVSVAAAPDVIVAGATGDDTGSVHGHGSVYVFERPIGGWASRTETAKLLASDGAHFDELGRSVAVSGGVIVAGAPCRDADDEAALGCQSQHESDEGALYVFEKGRSGWVGGTETARLEAAAGRLRAGLGSSVAVDGSVVVGGAPYQAGSTHIFERSVSGWADASETQTLTAAAQNESNLGRSVAAYAGVIAVGLGDPWNEGSVAVYAVPADLVAPVTTISAAPTHPDGSNGWYTTSPSVVVEATDQSSGVAETRCVVNPQTAPTAFEDLPIGCPLLMTTTLEGDGRRVVYAASVDSAGNAELPIRVAIDVDQGNPTVTCDSSPVVILGEPGVVTATVVDDVSGPVSSTVSEDVDSSTVGAAVADVTGHDVAGNDSSASCPYLVAYHLTVESPTSDHRFKAGSPIQVRFALRTGSGELIPTDEAQRLATECRATVRLDDAERQCASYSSRTGRFTVTLRTARTTAPGDHLIWTEVRSGSTYVNARSTGIVLR